MNKPAFTKNVKKPTHEQISKRAYEIFLKRKGKPGNAKEDWAKAEKELIAELNA